MSKTTEAVNSAINEIYKSDNPFETMRLAFSDIAIGALEEKGHSNLEAKVIIALSSKEQIFSLVTTNYKGDKNV